VQTRHSEPHSDVIVVPGVNGCLQRLTPQEVTAGIRRGKRWMRTQTAATREAAALTLKAPRAPRRSPTLVVHCYRELRYRRRCGRQTTAPDPTSP